MSKSARSSQVSPRISQLIEQNEILKHYREVLFSKGTSGQLFLDRKYSGPSRSSWHEGIARDSAGDSLEDGLAVCANRGDVATDACEGVGS